MRGRGVGCAGAGAGRTGVSGKSMHRLTSGSSRYCLRGARCSGSTRGVGVRARHLSGRTWMARGRGGGAPEAAEVRAARVGLAQREHDDKHAHHQRLVLDLAAGQAGREQAPPPATCARHGSHQARGCGGMCCAGQQRDTLSRRTSDGTTPRSRKARRSSSLRRTLEMS